LEVKSSRAFPNNIGCINHLSRSIFTAHSQAKTYLPHRFWGYSGFVILLNEYGGPIQLHAEDGMKTKLLSSIALAVLPFVIISLGCTVSNPVPTPTFPIPTRTATPIPPTRRPTSTPLPTATPQPTPAPVGAPVPYGSLEITVLDVIKRQSIHFGDVAGGFETFYEPLDGYFIIDVGVLVRNLEPGNFVQVKWSDVYILEENGNAWYPNWGQMQTVSPGRKVDPFSIGLSSNDVNGDEFIYFENDTCMRLIFSVQNDPEQTILFAIKDSPYIRFQVEE
jgi:hypothetical protein